MPKTKKRVVRQSATKKNNFNLLVLVLLLSIFAVTFMNYLKTQKLVYRSDAATNASAQQIACKGIFWAKFGKSVGTVRISVGSSQPSGYLYYGNIQYKTNCYYNIQDVSRAYGDLFCSAKIIKRTSGAKCQSSVGPYYDTLYIPSVSCIAQNAGTRGKCYYRKVN